MACGENKIANNWLIQVLNRTGITDSFLSWSYWLHIVYIQALNRRGGEAWEVVVVVVVEVLEVGSY